MLGTPVQPSWTPRTAGFSSEISTDRGQDHQERGRPPPSTTRGGSARLPTRHCPRGLRALCELGSDSATTRSSSSTPSPALSFSSKVLVEKSAQKDGKGGRIRSGSRPVRQLHHRLQRGKLRPLGIHTGRSIVVTLADTHQRRLPLPAPARHQDHTPYRHRRRMQRAVCLRPRIDGLPRHRGQRPTEPVFGTRIESHRISSGIRRRQTRTRIRTLRP